MLKFSLFQQNVNTLALILNIVFIHSALILCTFFMAVIIKQSNYVSLKHHRTSLIELAWLHINDVNYFESLMEHIVAYIEQDIDANEFHMWGNEYTLHTLIASLRIISMQKNVGSRFIWEIERLIPRIN